MSGEQKVGASILLAMLVWGIGLVSVTVVTRLPQRVSFEFALIPPVLAVFVFGLLVADHWWTRGALLIAVPPAASMMFLLKCALALQESAPGAYARGIVVALLFGVCALGAVLASVVAAALGVWIGRRVR